jgi:hypothetical protein
MLLCAPTPMLPFLKSLNPPPTHATRYKINLNVKYIYRWILEARAIIIDVVTGILYQHLCSGQVSWRRR